MTLRGSGGEGGRRKGDGGRRKVERERRTVESGSGGLKEEGGMRGGEVKGEH